MGSTGRNRSAWILGLYVVAFALFVWLRSFGDQTGIPVQYSYPISVDRFIFGGREPVSWLQATLHRSHSLDPLDVLMVVVYVSYFIVPPLMAAILWWRQSRVLLPYVLAMAGTLYLGLLINLLVPTAPPWLAAERGYLPPLMRIMPGVLDYVQRGIFESGDQVSGQNNVAAMPSLHTAMICVVAVFLPQRRRWQKAVAVLYPLLMGFALMYLGEHYFVDVATGLVLGLAVAWPVKRLFCRATHRKPEVPSSPDAAPLPGAD